MFDEDNLSSLYWCEVLAGWMLSKYNNANICGAFTSMPDLAMYTEPDPHDSFSSVMRTMIMISTLH